MSAPGGGLLAAIVCGHNATLRSPILFAQRDDPQALDDSGWQMSCGIAAEEATEDARVWALNEVAEYEPSLREFLREPPGTRLTRKSRADGWKVDRIL
jgi:hypothetical protein